MDRGVLVGGGIGIAVGLVVGLVAGVVSGIFGGAAVWGTFEATGGDIEAVFYLAIAGAFAGALVGAFPGLVLGALLGATVGALAKKKVSIPSLVAWGLIAVFVGALVGAAAGLILNQVKVFPVTSRQIWSESSQAVVWGGTGLLGGTISGLVLGCIAAIAGWLVKYSERKA